MGVGIGSGFGVANQEIEKAKAARAAQGNLVFRHRLKYGESSILVFLEEEPALVAREHSLYINKRVYNLVCPGDDCPLCEAGERASLVGYMSVMKVTAYPAVESPRYPDEDNLDDRDWEEDWKVIEDVRRKNGALVLNPIQVLPAKEGTLGILARHAQKREGLAGARFDVSRSTDSKSPAVGDNWDFEDKLDPDAVAILNPDAEPLDFDEALDIRTVEELREFAVNNSEGKPAPARSAGPSFKTPTKSDDAGEEKPKRRKLSW